MGYRIRVPEGYETLRKGRFAHTFTLVLPGGAHEYNVNLSPLGVDDMEEAVSTATMIGSTELADTKDLGNGYWVVKAPAALSVQQVWVFRKGQSASVTAKCTGPADDLAVLIDMCASLQVTK